jgi:hypothetical protein
MYREVDSSDQFRLEKDLALLETRAGVVLAKARKTFALPDATLTLTRTEKDCLRKFLFVMKYRGSDFYEKYNVRTIQDYQEPDKVQLHEYLLAHNMSSPRQLWCANLRVFLNIDMDPGRKWQEEIRSKVYKDHAELFLFHADHSYLAFCTPQDASDEFLLTENAYSVFEGAKSDTLSMASRMTKQTVECEWHNFAPVSSSLMIILRSNLLPGSVPFEGLNATAVLADLAMRQTFREPVVSALQDVPISRSQTSHIGVQVEGRLVSPAPSAKDTYIFQCFKLQRHHVDKINTVFLEDAPPASTIVYQHATAAARAIRAYLEDPRPTLKILDGNDSPREQYLRALERALRSLEGDDVPIKTISRRSPPLNRSFPLDYAGHHTRWTALRVGEEMFDKPEHSDLMQLYRNLGGSTAPDVYGAQTRWVEDLEQAGLIACFHTKIDRELKNLGLSLEEKDACKRVRRAFFTTLRPRSVWMYLKVFRNLEKFGMEDYRVQVAPLQCSGPEDVMVRRKYSSPLSGRGTLCKSSDSNLYLLIQKCTDFGPRTCRTPSFTILPRIG